MRDNHNPQLVLLGRCRDCREPGEAPAEAFDGPRPPRCGFCGAPLIKLEPAAEPNPQPPVRNPSGPATGNDESTRRTLRVLIPSKRRTLRVAPEDRDEDESEEDAPDTGRTVFTVSTVTLTAELIHAGKTGSGGWNRKQLL